MRRFVSPEFWVLKSVIDRQAGSFFYDDLQSYFFIDNHARLWPTEPASARGQVVSRGSVSV
jgi:hypothetical protein